MGGRPRPAHPRRLRRLAIGAAAIDEIEFQFAGHHRRETIGRQPRHHPGQRRPAINLAHGSIRFEQRGDDRSPPRRGGHQRARCRTGKAIAVAIFPHQPGIETILPRHIGDQDRHRQRPPGTIKRRQFMHPDALAARRARQAGEDDIDKLRIRMGRQKFLCLGRQRHCDCHVHSCPPDLALHSQSAGLPATPWWWSFGPCAPLFDRHAVLKITIH